MSTQGRKEYSYQEDVLILKYVDKHHLWAMTTGNIIWKEMENKKVPKP